MHRCIKIYTKDKLCEKRGGKGKMKEEKGITLIALVITIIILLILLFEVAESFKSAIFFRKK